MSGDEMESSKRRAAPKTSKQPSRKGKKAWRKNVDLTEVEKGIVDLNEEIIRGGVIKEKDSEDLFTIDIKGDAKQSNKLPNRVRKTLRADEIIAQRSSVPAVSMRKRPSDKTSDGSIIKRQKPNWVSQKELARLKRVADGQHDTTVLARDATFDIWDAPAQPLVKKDTENFLPEQVKAKVPKSMKQKPVSLTADGKAVAAVQKPAGRYSYNPAINDYVSRLDSEGDKAVKAEKEKLAQEEADRLKQEAAARSAAEAEAAEARADLSEWEEDSEWEGFQSGAEDDGKPSAKRPQRKTQAQRNRIKRRKEEERLAKHKAAMKSRRAQEQRIKDIAEEVSEREKSRALVRAAADVNDSDSCESEINDNQKLRRKQLGKFKLPERDLELVLPEELQDSLRLLKPEGNLLKDRYRSMLVRGKVEARRHIPFHKKAKRKFTEKWTHKDFVL